MFPFIPGSEGYKITPLAPAPLPEKIEVEFTFVDGPFDGRKSTATIGAVMSEHFTVVMKNDTGKFVYRYAGENTFRYEGKYEG